jgi:hypothetical protein
VLIEITPGTSKGTWNLVAKAKADIWPPMYMAYDRSPWAIKALVHGILQDHGIVETEPTADTDGKGRNGPVLPAACGATGPDDLVCERAPHPATENHGCVGVGELVTW